ncbi:RsmB/NOP family class I SAM-dependent RNA methyltransferase [Lysobacter korlensis]|uniref:RsmB/NOP family class I SAM-dependent RNA methyltransferase n=1 Tax=Lysobacter korlensis TaxID=553636 RepID=A0ABV6RZF5_9GAMM
MTDRSGTGRPGGRPGPAARPGQGRGTPQAGRSRSPQPARRIAYEVIAAVRESDAYANLLLPVKLERAKLPPADAALATELTYGTLRMQGYYDRVIALAAGRSVERIDAPLLDVLRLGSHQLLSMRVAPHAAVDEAVAQAASVGSRSGAGFVNGVLRTIGRTEPAVWRERVLAEARSADERLAVEHSHPEWVVRAFRQSLAADGREGDLEELLAADNAAPKVTLVALPGVGDDAGPDGEPTEYSPYGYRLSGGDPTRVHSVAAGSSRVQDEGSQLAALALVGARPIEAGERWLDLCAGPGGKAALLAAEARAGGAEFVANELVPARAQLVRTALAAVDPSIQVTELDGRAVGEAEPEAYDRILLDAPCTGLGALRRRPEARWRKQPKDVPELTNLQSELLDSALRALRPGGVLAYVTCSPHLAETRAVLETAVRRGGGRVRRLDARAALHGTRTPLPAGDSDTVQLWPHRHGTDAMFISLVTKVVE